MKKIKFCKEKIKTIGIGLFVSSIIFSGATFATDTEFNANLSKDYINWKNNSSEQGLMPRTYSSKVPDEIIDEYTKEEIPSMKEEFLLKALNLDTVSSIADSSRYNLAEEIPIRIKHQGKTSQCWAFSIISCLESNIALNTDAKTIAEIPDFSERHMDYATSRTFLDGTNENGYNRNVGVGGLPIMGLSYLANGTGAVLEEEMPFEDNEDKILLSELDKPVDTTITGYKLLTGIFKEFDGNGNVKYSDGLGNYYTNEEVAALRKIIKENIVENGAVASMTAGNHVEYYNNTTNPIASTAYFCNDSSIERDHAITIVGWDDNYSKENFNESCRPSTDGAYIVLNSYGENNFDNGYIYISYEDVLIESDLSVVTGSEKIDYDKLYQNDYFGGLFAVGTTTSDTGYYGATYSREYSDNEYLTDVGITVSDYVDVEIYLNPNGNSTLLSSLVKVGESTETLEPGYHKLDVTHTKLTGNDFSIVVKQKSENGIFYFTIETAVDNTVFKDVETSGNSYYSMDGYTWTCINDLSIPSMDMKSSDVCIKAFTKNIEEIPEDPTEDPTDKPINPDEPDKPTTEEIFTSEVYQISDSNIKKVKHETKKDDFLKNITTNMEIRIFAEDGTEITDGNTIIKTGMKLKLSNDKEYVIAVRGDMNCDGMIDIVDLSKLLAHYVQSKGFILENAPLLAADLNCDGVVDIIDISQMVVLYSRGV